MSAAAGAETRARLVRLGRFLARVLRKSRNHDLGVRASALAFSTLVSMVPLLAAVSLFVARTLREDDGRIVDQIIRLLPYREDAIVDALHSFLQQTEQVSGIALIGFAVTSLLVFLGVQDTLFSIFEIERPPSYLRRIVTFSLLVFWGPLLIGTAQAGLLVLGQSSLTAARLLRESFLLRAVPGLVTFIGLTMLYWRAAYKHISLRHAAAGAIVATFALEALKATFGIYVQEFTRVQRAVYGTFAIAFFFVLSVQIAWWILLLGAEIAACLRAEPEPVPDDALERQRDPWLGLAALEQLGQAGRPTLAAGDLARTLETGEDTLVFHLQPLVDNGLVERGLGAGSYRLSLPTRQVRLATALAAYRRREEEELHDHPLPPRVAALRIRLRRSLESELDETTLAELLGEEHPDDTVEVEPEPFGEATIEVPAERREAATADVAPLARPDRRS